MVIVFFDRCVFPPVRCFGVPPVAYDLFNELFAAGVDNEFPCGEEAIDGTDTIKDVVIGSVVGDPALLQFLTE